MALLARARSPLWLLLFAASSAQRCAGLTLFTGESLPLYTVSVQNYLSLAGQPIDAPLTTPMIYTNVVSANPRNFIVVFSPSAVGQFAVSTNGPPFQLPIRVGNSVYDGAESPAIQLTNALNNSTIEFALSDTNQTSLSVSGFVEVPALSNTAATYDLVVLASTMQEPPYSTEDWTLQLNCGMLTFIQFEDAGATVAKYGQATFPPNAWLYFTLTLDTANLTESGAVYDASDWSLITSYTNAMSVTNTGIDYWLFGNNEAGSQPGTCFYFSGLTWSNAPSPPPAPPYTPASNQLVAQWKFNGNFRDSSPNGNDGMEFGGSYSFVTGADGAAGHAIGITNGTITTFPTNPVSAITVSFWINTAAPGMPIAFDEFDSWYAYVAADGTVQFDLRASDGHLNASTTDNWFGAWHLYTATWDGAGDGQARIYRDGALDAVTSCAIHGPIVPPLPGLTIASGDSGFAMSGWLDDMRVYGRALNSSEVATLYALGADGNINLDPVPSTPQYLLTAGQFVQFWKADDLSTWTAAGPVTNRLVLSATEAAEFFRAQAMADLYWTPLPPDEATGYLVCQWYEPAPGTSACTNFCVGGNQTSVYLPLLGTGTNCFSVAPLSHGEPGDFSNCVWWPPAAFAIAMSPF